MRTFTYSWGTRSEALFTFEDMTGLFLKAAGNRGLVTHPEFWLNTRSLEREFSCACHTGNCEDIEQQSTCTVSFSWGSLDTALSIDGPQGMCEFFHDGEQDCPHLHTSSIPPLIIDLSYSLALHGKTPSEDALLSLTQILRLNASESSRRTSDTRPGVGMVLRDGQLYPDVLTLQQQVEIPLWHPLGMRGLHEESSAMQLQSSQLENEDSDDDDDREESVEREEEEIIIDEPHPEVWLPHIMEEVCQDILQVLATLDASVTNV